MTSRCRADNFLRHSCKIAPRLTFCKAVSFGRRCDRQHEFAFSGFPREKGRLSKPAGAGVPFWAAFNAWLNRPRRRYGGSGRSSPARGSGQLRYQSLTSDSNPPMREGWRFGYRGQPDTLLHRSGCGALHRRAALSANDRSRVRGHKAAALASFLKMKSAAPKTYRRKGCESRQSVNNENIDARENKPEVQLVHRRPSPINLVRECRDD